MSFIIRGAKPLIMESLEYHSACLQSITTLNRLLRTLLTTRQRRLQGGRKESLLIFLKKLLLMTCNKKPFAVNKKRASISPMKTVNNVVQAKKNFQKGISIGFTRVSSLKSMGILPRSSGCYILGNKYKRDPLYIDKQ
jgi:hypothetical protein